MLAIPSKASGKELDWNHALHRHLARAYSLAVADEHKPQIENVSRARTNVISSNVLSSEQAIEAHKNYYRLLGALEMRFDSAEMRMQYVWRDAFQQVVRMGEADLSYESAAVLFNLASEMSKAALRQPRHQPEGLKLACNLYQQAAGVLEKLTAHVASASWATRTTVDLSPHALHVMKTLMLAQAQRCYYEKAVLDAVSPKLLSRIAAQIGVFYEEVAAALRQPPLAGHLPETWSHVSRWNYSMFKALANYHLATVHADAYEYGAQVCRLQHAVSLLRGAAEQSARTEVHVTYTSALAKVSAAYELADKDNTTVYNEPVPPLTSLPPLNPRAIVKAVPIAELSTALTAEEDPFVSIVPRAVKAELAEYDGRVKAVLVEAAAALDSAITAGDAALQELDLPWSLQAVEQGDATGGLPLKLADAIEHAQRGGGVEALRSTIDSLNGLVQSCAGSAADVVATLDAEDEHELRMRTEHGQKWDLLASGAVEGTRIRTELASVEESLPRLFDAHASIAQVYDESIQQGSLNSLEAPLTELTQAIPHAGGSPLAALPVTSQLRSAIDALEAQRASRDELLYAIATLEGETVAYSFDKTADNLAGVELKNTENGCLGVEILALRAGAPCEAAGGRAGDTVLKVNGEAVATHAEATQRIVSADRRVELTVHRKVHDQALINAIVYRGEHTQAEILNAHLSRYAPLQSEVAKVVTKHGALLQAVRTANDRFTQARISETELQAKQDYFKALNQSVDAFKELSSRASDTAAELTAATERLESLRESAHSLAAMRLVQREELAERLAEESNAAPAAAAAAAEHIPPPQADVPMASGSPSGRSASASSSGLGGELSAAGGLGEDVTKLMEMGFSRDQAEGALETTANDLSQAIGTNPDMNRTHPANDLSPIRIQSDPSRE